MKLRLNIKTGYSLVEIIVVVSIIVMLSVIFMANIKKGENFNDLQLAMQELTQDFRIVQGNALSSSKPEGQTSVPCGYGINFHPARADRYIIFFEEPDGSGECYLGGGAGASIDYKWDVVDANDHEMETKLFPKNIEYNGPVRDIYYIPPYLTTFIDAAQPSTNIDLDFVHTSTNDQLKIRVNIYGLVEITSN